jgi:hypothetical protein
MTLGYVNYDVSPDNVRRFVHYSYVEAELASLAGIIILPTSCARIIVHPNHIRRKDSPS